MRPRTGHTDISGECVAFDTIIRFVVGCRYCLSTAANHARRFALAVPQTSSVEAARFAALVKEVFPGHVRQVLSDNGSEFQGAVPVMPKSREASLFYLSEMSEDACLC